MKLSLVTIAVLLSMTAAELGHAGMPLATEDVLAMAARIPREASKTGEPAGYDRSPDARAIAAAVATVASDRQEAALLLVYAAYESDLHIAARGDGGKSRGPWQLKYVPDEVAFSPPRAAHYWLWLAAESKRRCVDNPADEQLAALASGYCGRGRAKVRHRAEVARAIASIPTAAETD